MWCSDRRGLLALLAAAPLAASYKRLRTIEMNADQTTQLFILPRK